MAEIITVAVVGSSPEQLDRARAQNEQLARRGVERGRLTEERADDALGRIPDRRRLQARADGRQREALEVQLTNEHLDRLAQVSQPFV